MGKKRIVIKFGSSTLTEKDGHIDREKMKHYVHQIAEIKENGFLPVIVSSGAVAAGFRAMGYDSRPRLLAQKQAAAAVGQSLLMQVYQELFEQHGIVVSQLLLTRTDLTDRTRCLNAFNTLEALLKQGVVPIVNENDSVSVKELKFGDNDILSAYVANLVKASQLIIATDMNGLYTADPRKDPMAKHIAVVDRISDDIVNLAGSAGSEIGTGGMRSKIEAARVSLSGGIPIYIGKISLVSSVKLIIQGEGDGTYFPHTSSFLPVKKQWLGFHSDVSGVLVIDAGAEKALLEQGKSLLPVGVREINGAFEEREVVEVRNVQGRLLGRGMVNYDHDLLRKVKGWHSTEIKQHYQVEKLEVIHRDEWVCTLEENGTDGGEYATGTV